MPGAATEKPCLPRFSLRSMEHCLTYSSHSPPTVHTLAVPLTSHCSHSGCSTHLPLFTLWLFHSPPTVHTLAVPLTSHCSHSGCSTHLPLFTLWLFHSPPTVWRSLGGPDGAYWWAAGRSPWGLTDNRRLVLTADRTQQCDNRPTNICEGKWMIKPISYDVARKSSRRKILFYKVYKI